MMKRMASCTSPERSIGSVAAGGNSRPISSTNDLSGSSVFMQTTIVSTVETPVSTTVAVAGSRIRVS